MDILIIGSGGREHALIWKIRQSPLVSKIYCAPGNGGTRLMAENINLAVEEIKKLGDFAEHNHIALTIVGPEVPLTLGIADEFKKRGLKILGVDKKAAELEGSKIFAKRFFTKYNIPTARYNTFDNPVEAKRYVDGLDYKVVIKADGLAAGKGVTVCQNKEEAINAITSTMEKKELGEAGESIVIEELLEGEELSFLVITDGTNILPLLSACDHKRLNDGDRGPNTGGMGTISPAPMMTEALQKEIIDKIINPTISGMRQEGRLYRGVLFAGIMLCKDGPKVLEYNVRLGDPETQAILFRMKSDIVPIMEKTADSSIAGMKIEWYDTPSACIITASKGYPGKYEKGKKITGLEEFNKEKDLHIFHAGTALKDNDIVTNGGRVLGITASGNTLKDALSKAYKAAEKIRYDGIFFRKDIGKRWVR